jgi:transposase
VGGYADTARDDPPHLPESRMARRVFRPYDPTIPLPGPADLRDWLPPAHAVFVLSDLVDTLDLSAITAVYHRGDGGGNPPYDPVLLTKLLLYACMHGVVSSRAIAAKTYDDLAYRVLTVDQHPDFRTISDFRERHLAALRDLFPQVVRLAQRLGLVKLEQVAQDGTKVLANASKHRAMSYARMGPAEERLVRELTALLEAASAVDRTEDARFGDDRTGDELPPDLSGEIARREQRLATIRAAKAALDAEAAAAAAAIRAADAAERQRRADAGEPKKPGRPPDPPGIPKPTEQRNFTDPDSRIMKTADGAFAQAFNGQIAVDVSPHQIVVGCAVTNQAADAPHLAPMVEQVRGTLGVLPPAWTADTGYFSAANVERVALAGSTAYIPPSRNAHPVPRVPPAVVAILDAAGLGPPTVAGPEEAAAAAAMRTRLATEAGRTRYAQRKSTVEPVVGQIKQGRGLRRVLFRGMVKVEAEWTLWCLGHNLGKILGAMQADPTLRGRLAPG